jgi:hypothetical protein
MIRNLLFIVNGGFPLYFALVTILVYSTLIRVILLYYTLLFPSGLYCYFDTFPLFLALPALFRSFFQLY